MATIELGQYIVGAAYTVTSLFINYTTAAATADCVYTLRKNGVDTALTVSIAHGATSGSQTGASVSVSVNDVLTLKCVASTTDGTTINATASAY
jgi:hypothetical protein